jgi:carbon-monoxide dehydrogenase medium subunit
MWNEYYCVDTLNQALTVLAEYGPRSCVVAGATDLILELERGQRKGVEVLVDISRVRDLEKIFIDSDGYIHLGPLVTHNHCVSSELVVKRAFPLAQAAFEVGAPQIRNRGTITGNLVTASPANDTIPPLMALDAIVVLQSKRGSRQVALKEFYTGVRKTVMEPDELVVEIRFRAMPAEAQGAFIKIGLRKAQAISVVNAAVILYKQEQKILNAVIALGSVAPTVIRAAEAEQLLITEGISEASIAGVAAKAIEACRPIGDVRGSADYRREMIRVAVSRILEMATNQRERQHYPESPVLLRKPVDLSPVRARFSAGAESQAIVATINGREMKFDKGYRKTLLHLLRDEGGLTGTKEGCSEGECGSCTVIMDGMAVMSCLVPAPRAHGAEIVTVEGLRTKEMLHPLQQAFIDTGAVQCGYCTPGFLMSGSMLLQERPLAKRSEILQAFTGNLCRCTGYYKIIEAVEKCVLGSK